jgi:hypothetical protein
VTRRALVLAAAAALYVAAAWHVAPGFYDGIAPPAPYCWLTPPPSVTNTCKPASGQRVAKVTRGTVDPGTAFTDDGQAQLSWVPGAFEAPAGGASVTVSIAPAGGRQAPEGVRQTTNVYQITATSPLAKGAVVTLRYSDQLPAPSDLYLQDQSGSWRKIGSSTNTPTFTISATTPTLGYFVAGYPSNVSPPAHAPTVGGGQLLPILVAGAILLVILAGVPLAVLRRRSDAEEGGDRAGRR